MAAPSSTKMTILFAVVFDDSLNFERRLPFFYLLGRSTSSSTFDALIPFDRLSARPK